MSQKNSFKNAAFFRGVSLIVGVLAMSLAISFAVLAWTGPSAPPPGANADRPLNVGNVGQSKQGGLILNTGGAPNGLIVDQGNVGIGVPAPGAKLDIAGQVKIQGGTPGAGKVLTSDASGLASWGSGGGGITTQNVVTASRQVNTTYQNTTGKSMVIAVVVNNFANQRNSYYGSEAYSDSNSPPITLVARTKGNYSNGGGILWESSITFIVLPGHYYKVRGYYFESLGEAGGCGCMKDENTMVNWTEWH